MELELRESNPVAAVKPPKVVKRTPVILNPDRYEALLRECERDPMLWLYSAPLSERQVTWRYQNEESGPEDEVPGAALWFVL